MISDEQDGVRRLRLAGPEDDAETRLHGAYDELGGVATGDEVARVLMSTSDRAVSRVARWIVERRVVSFTCQSQIVLPLFQFEPKRMEPLAGLGLVLAEWVDVLDDLEVAQWFVEPNVWLGYITPAEVLSKDADVVLKAARADRFVVCG